MSQENVEIALRNIEAFNRRDLRTWLATFAPTRRSLWSRPPAPHERVYRGRGRHEAFWTSAWRLIGARLRRDLTEAGSEVVVPNTSCFSGRRGIEGSRNAVPVQTPESARSRVADVPRAPGGPRSRGLSELDLRRSPKVLFLCARDEPSGASLRLAGSRARPAPLGTALELMRQ